MAEPMRDDPLAWSTYRWEKQFGTYAGRFVAATSVMRVNQLILGTFDAVLKPLNLTRRSYLFLMTIAFSSDSMRLLSRISETLLVHPTTVTLLADQMQERGLVIREPHPSDRRAIRLQLTEAGATLAQDASRQLEAAEFGLRGLTDLDVDEQLDALRQLRIAAGDPHLNELDADAQP